LPHQLSLTAHIVPSQSVSMGLHNYRRIDNGQERLETPSYALPTINHDDTLASMTSMTSKCQMIDLYGTHVIYGTRNPYQPAGRGQFSPLQKQQRWRAVIYNAQQLVHWRSCSNLWGSSPRCIPIDLNDRPSYKYK